MINKRIILTLCVLLFTHVISAQTTSREENTVNTIFGSEETNISGFGGVSVNFSSVADEFGVFTGGFGGVIINRSIILGLEGHQLATDITHRTQDNKDLNFNYGGIFGGYIFGWQSRVHFNTTVMIGWGGIGTRKEHILDKYFGEYFKTSDDLFVLQPELEVELNVFKILRVGVGVNYRIVSGVNTRLYNNDDFSSLGGVVSIKFGGF